MKQKNKIWNLAFAVCSVAGLILCYLAFKPGFMSPDTIDQYGQALTGKYNDWHPVTMALVWHLLLKIHNGPQPMLLLQLTLLWTACFFIARSLKGITGLLFTAVFLVAPFIHNFSGYIIKDVQMAGAWLLAAALIMNALVAGRKQSLPEIVICYLLLIYGALLRIDALPGLIPLLILWAMVSIGLKRRRLVLLLAATIGLIFLVQAGLTKLAGPAATFPERKLYMHDLAGIAVKTGINPFPEGIYEDTAGRLDIDYIKSNYHPATFDMLWWNGDGPNVHPSASKLTAKKLKQAWWRAIKSHPGIYLSNRWDGFMYHLRIKQRTEFYSNFHVWVQDNEYGIKHNRSALYNFFDDWIGRHKYAFYMQAWFWMALNILLFIPVGLMREKPFKRAIILLLLSSLLYRLPQFFIFQTDTDFRYFYWTCLTCMLAVFYIIRGLQKAPQKS